MAMMPQIAPPGQPGGAPPSPAGGGGPGTPPMGSSPVTAPTQNLGSAAAGMQQASALVNAMAMTLPKVGAHTELGQAIAKAINDIGKHLPPGSGSPQGESNFIRQMAMRNQQMAPQRAAMAQQAGAPGPAMAGPSASPPPPGV